MREKVSEHGVPERMMHIAVTKRYLLHVLAEEENWRQYFIAWEGTKEELEQAIRDDPRDLFTGCDCDKAPNGECLGMKEGR